jgi:hypothetical protein
MPKMDLTFEMLFGFDGPNLCLLGNEDDFQKLAKAISDFTALTTIEPLNIRTLGFVENVGLDKKIIFSAEKGQRLLGVFDHNKNILFKLDPKVWERIFKYFVFMSWRKD